MKKKLFALLAFVMTVMTASAALPGYELTKGTSDHGSIAFTVNGQATEYAQEGNLVTVTVTPATGYATKEVTAVAYAKADEAKAPRRAGSTEIELLQKLTVSGSGNTWTFTMPAAHALVSATYTRVIQSSWVEAIEDQTYTGQPLEPAVVIKDGDKTLVEGTDYTVEYSNNVEAGSSAKGTATITGIGDYSGTLKKEFNILPKPYDTTTNAIDLNVPEGLGQLDGNGGTTDLYYFLQDYLQKSPNPAYIKLRLEPDAQYVISKTLTVVSAITIEGDATAPATIDATALGANPFVKIGNNYTSGLVNEKGFCYNMYDVTFKNFYLTGLKGQFFYANKQKYLIPYFTVDNCVIRMEGASKKTFFDFNGGGFVENFTLNNSTLSSDDATSWQNGGFFSTQSGSKRDEAGASVFKLTITNNTFYKVADSKTLCSLRENSQSWMTYKVMNNIIINTGKKNEFTVGLAGANTYANANWLVQYNSFLWTTDNETFEDINAAEIAKASTYPIAACVEGKIVFANGKDGIAEGDFSLDGCPQKEAKIGDPRWLSASLLSKRITIESLDDDKDLAKAINQGVKDGFSRFTLEANARYSVKQAIVTDKALSITGNNVKIDVEHSDVFILLNSTPAVDLINDYYRMDAITLKGLTVTGLKNSIIYDNNTKYCVVDLTIDDCVLGLETVATKNQAFISFQQGGVKDFTMKNSTVYQAGAEENNYFLRYNNSARLDRYGYDKNVETQSINYINNTFYKVGKNGQWGNYNGIAGQAYSEFHVTGNIWVDCGNGQIARRLLGGRNASSYKTCEFNNNTYWFNGAAETGNTSYDEGNQLTTDPGFKNAAEADFTLSAYSEQATEKTGDPRWNAEPHYNTAIEGVAAEKADDGAWYTIQGIRTDKPAKGLYIHNGRKVVVK